jgi:hypothetical protein
MCLRDFLEQHASLVCAQCGVVGLDVERNPNNGGVRPICPHCGSRAPLAGVQWLKQRSAHGRRPRRFSGDPTTLEVWKANGEHCAFCGKSRELCQRLGTGLTIQHVHPVVLGGALDSPLIPFCARCQQMSTAALQETRRVEAGISTLRHIIRRIEEKAPHLLAEESLDGPERTEVPAVPPLTIIKARIEKRFCSRWRAGVR